MVGREMEKRDLILGLGLVAITLFGSAIESTGWAGIAAMFGVAGGLALMLIGGMGYDA